MLNELFALFEIMATKGNKTQYYIQYKSDPADKRNLIRMEREQAILEQKLGLDGEKVRIFLEIMNRVMHHRGSPNDNDNDNEYRVALNKLRLMKLDLINDVLSRLDNIDNIMEKLNSLFGLFTLIEERVRRYSNSRSY